jgi:hypothetical protein
VTSREQLVLTRKAARLQELDAQLAAIERLLKMEAEGRQGPAGRAARCTRAEPRSAGSAERA